MSDGLKEKVLILESDMRYTKERLNELLLDNRKSFERVIGQIEQVNTRLEMINSLNHKITLHEGVMAGVEKELEKVKKNIKDNFQNDNETKKLIAEVEKNLKMHEAIEKERTETMSKTVKSVLVAGQILAGGVAFLISYLKGV